MFFNDYYKASSYRFGICGPFEYRLFIQKHGHYLVVHSKKCKQCKNLDIRQRWTGNKVCSCGNPYINRVSDQKYYRTEHAWRDVQRKGLQVLAAKYLRAEHAYSKALLQDKWTQRLQDTREQYSYQLMSEGIDVPALGAQKRR